MVVNVFAGDHGYDFLEGGLGAAFFHHRVAVIHAALKTAGASLHPQPAAGTGNLVLEQRMALLGEKPLPGSARPASHSLSQPPRWDSDARDVAHEPADVPESRESILERAVAAGIVGAGAGLTARFVTAGTLAAEKTAGWSTAKESAAIEMPATEEVKEAAPYRTLRDWAPDHVLCRRFNVPDPYQGRHPPPQLPSQDLLAAKPSARATIYADNLPAFLKPPEAGGQGRELPLPPPPGRPAAAPHVGLARPRGTHSGGGGLVSQQVLPPPPARGRLADTHESCTSAAGAGSAIDTLVDQLLASADTQIDDAAAAAAAAVAEVPVEKPLDIFKAIFEKSDDEESESDNEDDKTAVGAVAATNAGAEEQDVVGGGRVMLGSGTAGEADRGTAGCTTAAKIAEDGSAPTDMAAALSQAQLQMAAHAAAHRAHEHSIERARGRGPGVSRSPSVDLSYNSDDRAQRCRRHARRMASPVGRAGSEDMWGERRKDGDTGRRTSEHRKESRKERKARKKEDKRERRRHREELVQRALETVQQDVLHADVSTDKILEMARALKKRARERSLESASDEEGRSRGRNKGNKANKGKRRHVKERGQLAW
jgi:hypothetical protein